jgi:hypothetical protein
MQVDFASHLDHDFGNDFLMSVDGIGFHIPQQGKAVKGNAFDSPKYSGKFALR